MVQVEFILQAVIVRGFRTLRQDSRLIDQLFRNVSQTTAQEMRDFIRSQKIDLCINYPKDGLKIPAIVILLKAENERQAFLNDTMGYQTPDELSYDGELEGELLGGVASASTMSGQGPIEFGPYVALSGTNNTLRVDSSIWSTDQFTGRSLTIHIVSGSGAGQVREIASNSVHTVMVAKNWTTTPDSTSIFEIRKPALEVIGQPSALYDRRQNQLIERLGGMYAANYQIQVIGPNPELTIFLTTLVKAILTMSRMFLEQQGVIDMRLSATDFLPRAEYQPDYAYMRALNIDFVYPFDIFVETEAITELRLALEAPLSESEVMSLTTINLEAEPIVL